MTIEFGFLSAVAGSPIIAAAIILTTGFFAGIYPAFYISAFKPVGILKGINSKSGKTIFRTMLVSGQFGFAILLIVGAMVVRDQINFVESNKRSLKVYGRDRYIYACPIYKSDYGKIKVDDECSGCHCFAGELEAMYPLGDEPKYPEHIVECIGHVRKEYNSLLTAKGIRLKDRW